MILSSPIVCPRVFLTQNIPSPIPSLGRSAKTREMPGQLWWSRTFCFATAPTGIDVQYAGLERWLCKSSLWFHWLSLIVRHLHLKVAWSTVALLLLWGFGEAKVWPRGEDPMQSEDFISSSLQGDVALLLVLCVDMTLKCRATQWMPCKDGKPWDAEVRFNSHVRSFSRVPCEPMSSCGPGEVMEHLRRGELRDPKPQEISTPQELLEHAKTCKKNTSSLGLDWIHFLSCPIRSHEEHQN